MFGAIPSSVQDLLLALHLRTIPGGFRRQYRMPGIEPQMATCKANTLHCTIALVLQLDIYYNVIYFLRLFKHPFKQTRFYFITRNVFGQTPLQICTL